MSKHLKLFSALLVLMVLAPISVFVFPSNAEAARSLVENSWRYEDGQLVAEDASSEEDGIALLSMDILPDGATAQGIDVSEHQGRIDWNAVKASGIDFAILRVGFGAPSWGGRVDYQFNRNISECERLGIPYGVYIYSYAFDNQQAADEASMVINCLSGHNPRLPVYYDLEDNSIIANGRQTGIASRAQVFCNRISAAGYEPGIYANLNWFNNILTDSVFKSSSWDHWIAQYNSQCDYTGNYSFWQYNSNGKVLGINGNVDMNYAYVDVSLYHWQLIDSTGIMQPPTARRMPDGCFRAARGTGSSPTRAVPWQPAFTSATAPCTGLIRPAPWRPGGSSTAVPGTTRRDPARWRAAPYPSAACPTASTPGRGPC